jgi:hypothetical protein
MYSLLMPVIKKPRPNCLNCKAITERPGYKYCSNQCQRDYQYKQYILAWRLGKVDGLQRLGVVSRHIKRYLREKYYDRCSLCDWREVNPYTGVVPLVADHIDGSWRNNTEENLRLVCPNCDSLGPTYAGLNRGNGRTGRKMSKRVEEAREISSKLPKQW